MIQCINCGAMNSIYRHSVYVEIDKIEAESNEVDPEGFKFIKKANFSLADIQCTACGYQFLNVDVLKGCIMKGGEKNGGKTEVSSHDDTTDSNA